MKSPQKTLWFVLANTVACLVAGVYSLAVEPQLRLVDVVRIAIGILGCPFLVRMIYARRDREADINKPDSND